MNTASPPSGDFLSGFSREPKIFTWNGPAYALTVYFPSTMVCRLPGAGFFVVAQHMKMMLPSDTASDSNVTCPVTV